MRSQTKCICLLVALWAAMAVLCPPASAEPPAVASPSSVAHVAKVSGAVAAQPAKMVRLEFQGQQWLAVLQWLAKMRNLNVDWQQLPEGTLNLASANEYSLDDAEDLINMQLLARGFTLLQRGEVLRLAPLKNIDITLVPRVEAQELEKLPRHKFVRVTFPLDWMIAEEAATEFKPLISPYGQLFPMASSNRLEAMDAVVNLRELQRLLKRAEAEEGRRERVAVFRLKHRKADDAAVKVRQLLGLRPEVTAQATAAQTQLDIETTKLRSEAVKQMGASAQPLLTEKPELHLVVNREENSILINGRPDKIDIVRQAIEAIDKPEPPRESSWTTFNRVKIYPVGGFDPASITQLMQALQARGNISKETQIQHEAAFNRLVVFASPEDQVTIAGIIDSFRTEGRRAEVLSLGQIDARYATKAIKLVLKNPERPVSATGLTSEGRFQIEPDSAHNRLLLWATPTESAEVRQFLAGLGETFTSSKAAAQMHVVPLRGAKATAVVERLKTIWKEVSDAPLVIESGNQESGTPKEPVLPAKPVSPQLVPTQKSPPMGDRIPSGAVVQLAAQQQPLPPASGSPEPKPSTATTKPLAGDTSPVRILSDKDDEMIIFSRDPATAEAARLLIDQMVPAEASVQVISLKHAQAALVKTQIDALLAQTRTADYSELNTDEPLLVEADSRMNRLLIRHATQRQMRQINEIVPLLDLPVQEDERLVRRQQVYRPQRKRASEIALVVKDVYRDLLSTSDKVFDARIGNRPFGYSRAMAATGKSPEYQGLLSVGADDAGNILVLSAPAYLMDDAMQVVKLIDSNANIETVAVVSVPKTANPKLGQALDRLLAKPK